MRAIHFITHPQVTLDPGAPVPDWPLSLAGLDRMRCACETPMLHEIARGLRVACYLEEAFT